MHGNLGQGCYMLPGLVSLRAVTMKCRRHMFWQWRGAERFCDYYSGVSTFALAPARQLWFIWIADAPALPTLMYVVTGDSG